MAQHDSFRVAGGSRGIDESTAVVGPKTLNHSIQLLVGHVLSHFHELCPLQKYRDYAQKSVLNYSCVVQFNRFEFSHIYLIAIPIT